MNRSLGRPGRLVVVCCLLFSPFLLSLAPRAKDSPENPAPFKGRGRLLCLSEEMRARFEVRIPPVHDHLLGFRVESEAGDGAPRYWTILRTSLSEALFRDKRFQEHPLIISGKTFPGTSLLEVIRFWWVRGGKVFDVYYWCDVCSIKGVDPGACACCQGEVELREDPVNEAGKRPG